SRRSLAPRVTYYRSVRRREGDPERRALARQALAGDLAAVGGDDFLDDRQPQPGAGLVAVPGDTEEAVEDVRQVLRRDADPGVRDRQHHAPVLRRGREGHLAPGR